MYPGHWALSDPLLDNDICLLNEPKSVNSNWTCIEFESDQRSRSWSSRLAHSLSSPVAPRQFNRHRHSHPTVVIGAQQRKCQSLEEHYHSTSEKPPSTGTTSTSATTTRSLSISPYTVTQAQLFISFSLIYLFRIQSKRQFDFSN